MLAHPCRRRAALRLLNRPPSAYTRPPTQKRRWLANCALLAGPFLICGLLWVLQNVINAQLDSRAFRCGCRCTACCDWVAPPPGNSTGGELTYQCYQATEERPCSPYAECQARAAGAAPADAQPCSAAVDRLRSRQAAASTQQPFRALILQPFRALISKPPFFCSPAGL